MMTLEFNTESLTFSSSDRIVNLLLGSLDIVKLDYVSETLTVSGYNEALERKYVSLYGDANYTLPEEFIGVSDPDSPEGVSDSFQEVVMVIKTAYIHRLEGISSEPLNLPIDIVDVTGLKEAVDASVKFMEEASKDINSANTGVAQLASEVLGLNAKASELSIDLTKGIDDLTSKVNNLTFNSDQISEGLENKYWTGEVEADIKKFVLDNSGTGTGTGTVTFASLLALIEENKRVLLSEEDLEELSADYLISLLDAKFGSTDWRLNASSEVVLPDGLAKFKGVYTNAASLPTDSKLGDVAIVNGFVYYYDKSWEPNYMDVEVKDASFLEALVNDSNWSKGIFTVTIPDSEKILGKEAFVNPYLYKCVSSEEEIIYVRSKIV